MRIKINLQNRVLSQRNHGYNFWETVNKTAALSTSESACLICDVWDKHWSRGATERIDRLAPQINTFIAKLRPHGVRVIHAPSGVVGYYSNSPAKQRLDGVEVIAPPQELNVVVQPLPVDASDGGSDTGETAAQERQVWTRQHLAIGIDQAVDIIGDDGLRIYSFLKREGITNLFMVGVHTNKCMLTRSYGIEQMVRWGINVILVRDLTDAMYNPAMPPYVSHEQGTQLVVEYIEKFWCPTVSSKQLLHALGNSRTSLGHRISRRLLPWLGR